MAVKTKVIIVIVVLLVAAGAAGAFWYFSTDGEEGFLPDLVEDESWVFPYTGLKTTDEQTTKMRPLCVKLVNDPKGRPQTNINRADVVYETMIEGGETRMNAIFQSDIPDEVGPVRSARLSDIWIVPQYDGMLFFSGANDQVRGEIASHDLTDMRWDYAESIYFRAQNGRGDLHNLHIELSKAYEVAEGRGYETSTSALIPLHFEGVKYDDVTADENDSETDDLDTDSKLEAFDDESTSGSSVSVKFYSISNTEFRWNEEKEKYFKWMNGEEHKDAATDEQINVDNVVIMWAEYIQQAKKDAAGSPTYDTNLGGNGDAAIFKDGKRYDCTWESDATTPPRFYDSMGSEILLNPGQTWIVVPDQSMEISSE